MMQLHIDVQALLTTLPIMLKGMIGIFIVIGVVWIFIVLLNKITAAIAERKESDTPQS